MAKESKTLLGALLMPTRGSSLPTGRLVKLTDDLESFRELIDCKTIEHLSTGWAPGVVLDAFMDEEGMLARKPYFVFQGTKLFGNVLLLRRGKNSDSDSLTFNDFMAITELCLEINSLPMPLRPEIKDFRDRLRQKLREMEARERERAR